MNYFRAYAEFETGYSPEETKTLISGAITELPYKQDKKRTMLNSASGALFYKPRTGLRFQRSSIEPLVRIGIESSGIGSYVSLVFEVPKATVMLLVLLSSLCILCGVLSFGLSGVELGTVITLFVSCLIAPVLAFGFEVFLFRSACRRVLNKIEKRLSAGESIKLMSEFDVIASRE